MADNPLSPAAALAKMAEALPTHEKDDTSSDLSSSLDAISLFTHACMVGLGFRLLGFEEDQKIGTFTIALSFFPPFDSIQLTSPPSAPRI